MKIWEIGVIYIWCLRVIGWHLYLSDSCEITGWHLSKSAAHCLPLTVTLFTDPYYCLFQILISWHVNTYLTLAIFLLVHKEHYINTLVKTKINFIMLSTLDFNLHNNRTAEAWKKELALCLSIGIGLLWLHKLYGEMSPRPFQVKSRVKSILSALKVQFS